MDRHIIRTADGSKTLRIPAWEEHYHSTHGALQESRHVFIRHGLQLFSNTELRLLEAGFGTGLNAMLTLLEAPARHLNVSYTGLEAYPLSTEEWEGLGYGELLGGGPQNLLFERLHQAPWDEPEPITDSFTLRKLRADIREFADPSGYHLIYFDAFGARVQPELWTETVFGNMFGALLPGGVLVTYAAKGSVRRAMQAVGFKVERLPGPPGKREMLRAVRES